MTVYYGIVQLSVSGMQWTASVCASNGVVFKPTKFHFAREEIELAGFNIT